MGVTYTNAVRNKMLHDLLEDIEEMEREPDPVDEEMERQLQAERTSTYGKEYGSWA